MHMDLVTRFRALADPTRLMLLGILLDEQLTVGELAEVCQTAQPGVSRHLSALREAGLVSPRRQGAMTFYRAQSQDLLLQGPVRSQIETACRQPAVAQRIQKVLERRRARARAFFDDQAADWDGLRAELFNDTAAFASLMPLVPSNLSVVDIGTGTGAMLPYLSEIAHRVVGIDQSAQMLQHARDRARRLGIPKAEFHRADVGKLPLKSGTFDAAFAALVLHHAPKPIEVVSEMARVVKPGGHVIAIDLCAHSQEWLRDEQADLWLGFSRDEMLAMLSGPQWTDYRFRVVSRAARRRGAGPPLELFVASARKRPKNGPI
jgi:SAM-dependent methyltransferase